MPTENPLRLAIAAIVKNEAPYLLEWIAYHRIVGVDHFFIADNNSNDGTTELLADLHRAGIVIHIPFPHHPGSPPQLPAYREIMHRHRGDADWFAFIDADEFLFPTDGSQSIRDLMDEIAARENVGAIAVNWAIYGSSGHKATSDRPVIERFDHRAEQSFSVNCHYKSLVRASAWNGTSGTPHHFTLSGTYAVVHPNLNPLDQHANGEGLSKQVVWDRLRLNHYIVKSETEFVERKQPKGRADAVGRNRTADFFSSHDRNEVGDPIPKWAIERTNAEVAKLQSTLGFGKHSVAQRLATTRPKLRLAIAAIVKNEAPYLLEWIAYHRAVGVDRFFVADNSSEDGTTAILSQLHRAGIVEHIPFPDIPGQRPQLAAYGEIMQRHGGEADWFAFIDADEFLFPTDGEHSIRPAIEAIAVADNSGALVVNWATFGSSGNEVGESRPVIERFSRRAEQAWQENFHYKSIVRSSAFSRPHGNPHLFVLREGFRAVGTRGEEVVDHPSRGFGLSATVCWDRLRLNHYVVKSREEFRQNKSTKGSATTPGRIKGEDYFRHHDQNEVEDHMPEWLLVRTLATMQEIRDEMTAGGHTQSAPPRVALIPRSIRGFIDTIKVANGLATVTGWAVLNDGKRVPNLAVRVGNTFISNPGLRRMNRTDVVQQVSRADLDSGFVLTIPVEELSRHGSSYGPVTVYGRSDRDGPLDLKLRNSVAWPNDVSASAPARRPPQIMVPRIPAMPELAAQRLYESMAASDCYLEYGTGGSTIQAFERGVPAILGVESDADWLASVRQSVTIGPKTKNHYLLLSDIGPTKELGYPTSEAAWMRYHKYPLDIWSICRQQSLSPDTVLVDGRFRVACMLASLLFSRPGCTILFDDYLDRPQYHSVEAFAPRHATFDRMCEFRVPASLPRDEVWLALIAAVSDAR